MGSDFNLVSKTLTGHYVFYDRLQDDGYDALYNLISYKMDEAALEAKRARINTDFIYSQANIERQKELDLIERMTGFRPSSHNWGSDSSDIIDAINLCINSKDVYQRIYQTIVTNGKTRGKGVFSFFDGYLQSTLNNEWSDFMKTQRGKKVFDISEQEMENRIYDLSR